MKKFRLFAALTLCTVLLFSTTSCLVVVKKDNGKHKGWFKHHANPGKGNPGKGNSGHGNNGNGKGNGNKGKKK